MKNVLSNNNPILVYRASAGSGKTFTLVTYYIACILSSDSPQAFGHVLAVTFTNKATAEMKSRILETLYGIIHRLPESDNSLSTLMALTQLDETILRERATQALTAILHAYHRFAISTIDAFQKSIVQGIAMELGLPAGFQVDIDVNQAIHDAVELLFGHLKDPSYELQWIVDSINNRLDDDKKWDMRRNVEDFARNNLFSEHVLQNEEALHAALQGNKPSAYVKLMYKLKAQAKKELAALADRWDRMMAEKGICNEDFSRGSVFGSYIKKLRECDSSEPSKTIAQRIEDEASWIKKKDSKDATLRGLVPTFKELLIEIEEERKKWFRQYNSAKLTLKHMPSLCLLNSIDSIIRQQREERNHFMLARIPMLIHELQGNEDASFVFEKSGIRFEHILMDECQDTSSVQWDNFKNLFLQNAASGQTDLLVGDAKQSIYRWRGSDYRLLENVSKEQSFKGRVSTRTLDTNYRSDKIIVDFNNRFFSILREEMRTSLPEIGDIYAHVEQKAKSPQERGSVNITLYGPSEEEKPGMRTMQDMAEEILRLHQSGLPFNQMIVLTRKNTQLQDFIDFCTEKSISIPLVSDEAFQLDASVGVQTIVESLRCLIDPQNLVAKTFVAYQYARFKESACASLPIAAKSPNRLLPFDMNAYRQDLLSMPLIELIEFLILKFNITDWPGQASYVHGFLDEVMTFVADHSAHAAELIEEWDAHMHEIKIPVTGNDGVRLLTIHKAKGLEAHTVFLPFCEWPLVSKINGQTFWCEPTEAPYNQLPTVPVSKEKTAAQSIYEQAYLKDRNDESIESINLLYVAFTRAKENLYVYAPLKKESNEETVAHIIRRVIDKEKRIFDDEDFHYTLGQPEIKQREKTTSKNPLHQPTQVCTQALRIYESNLEFKQSNESLEFTQGEENVRLQYIQHGNLLHKLFSSIHKRDEAEVVFKQYRQQNEFYSQSVIDEGRRLFYNGMKNKQIADWFDDRWEVKNESSLLLPQEKEFNVRRPDRVLIGPNNQAIVIDFKFAKPQEAHFRQVSEYKEILTRMGYAAVKGFLWYVYPNNVVEI